MKAMTCHQAFCSVLRCVPFVMLRSLATGAKSVLTMNCLLAPVMCLHLPAIQSVTNLMPCSLRSSVVLTHTPIEIAVAAMYFSLKMHKLNQHIPGGLRWYADWNITEDRIQGNH